MKVKFKAQEMYTFVGCLKGVIISYKDILSREYSDEDCVILALMEELYISLSKKIIELKSDYSFDLKPPHAFAVRVVFSMHTIGNHYAANLLRQLCDRIHQEYSTKV